MKARDIVQEFRNRVDFKFIQKVRADSTSRKGA